MVLSSVYHCNSACSIGPVVIISRRDPTSYFTLTLKPVFPRDQILRREREQENIYFPCSADHEQDWQSYPVDPYSAISDGHTLDTYTHTNILVRIAMWLHQNQKTSGAIICSFGYLYYHCVIIGINCTRSSDRGHNTKATCPYGGSLYGSLWQSTVVEVDGGDSLRS